MCGICGVVRIDAGATTSDALVEGDRRAVRGMMDSLRHRGPDGDGFWGDERAQLGHLRLAIIDLECGHQPMLNEDGRIAVVFNGEIYNFADLRAELAAKGHAFRTRSDTEVLVHGYEEWGDALVARLRGMFAFALWDAPRRRMLMARDRLGEKPLYFHLGGGRLAFASEIKALFGEGTGVERAMDEARLAEYLGFRSIAGAGTLFRGVRQLEPGTLVVIESGEMRPRRYWSPDPLDATGAPVASTGERGRALASGTDALVGQGRALLRDAVACRLVSDVKVGSVTSGGLDSSLVSAIATEAAGAPLDTFCVGFEDARYDERPYARSVAERIGARHHEIVTGAAEIDRELDRLTWAHDEPLTHPNSIPMHLIFREAKERAGVTVVLSGEGADEVFGGYGWYAAAMRRARVAGLPVAGPALSTLLPFLPAGVALGRLRTLKKVLDPSYLLAANAVTERADVLALAAGDYLGARPSLWPAAEGADGLFVYDQRTYLMPLLQRQDRMAMAAGVEARVVFLDHDLVRWANALPATVKLEGGQRKALLKRIAGQWLGDDIVHRQKVGFAMPLGAWLRRGGPLGARAESLRDAGSFARGLVDARALDALLDAHDAGRADHGDLVWTLVALDAWARTFLGADVRRTTLPGANRPPAAPGLAAAG